jgi:hypothetical protein
MPLLTPTGVFYALKSGGSPERNVIKRYGCHLEEILWMPVG